MKTLADDHLTELRRELIPSMEGASCDDLVELNGSEPIPCQGGVDYVRGQEDRSHSNGGTDGDKHEVMDVNEGLIDTWPDEAAGLHKEPCD